MQMKITSVRYAPKSSRPLASTSLRSATSIRRTAGSGAVSGLLGATQGVARSRHGQVRGLELVDAPLDGVSDVVPFGHVSFLPNRWFEGPRAARGSRPIRPPVTRTAATRHAAEYAPVPGRRPLLSRCSARHSLGWTPGVVAHPSPGGPPKASVAGAERRDEAGADPGSGSGRRRCCEWIRPSTASRWCADLPYGLDSRYPVAGGRNVPGTCAGSRSRSGLVDRTPHVPHLCGRGTHREAATMAREDADALRKRREKLEAELAVLRDQERTAAEKCHAIAGRAALDHAAKNADFKRELMRAPRRGDRQGSRASALRSPRFRPHRSRRAYGNGGGRRRRRWHRNAAPREAARQPRPVFGSPEPEVTAAAGRLVARARTRGRPVAGAAMGAARSDRRPRRGRRASPTPRPGRTAGRVGSNSRALSGTVQARTAPFDGVFALKSPH